MINLLIKLFVGKNADASDSKVRAKYASLAGITGIIVNVLLFIGKLTVGILAASVAIIADAGNNIADAGSAIVALIGFHLASKPVDKEHPLGHGRLEYIAGFIVDMLIILVGFELITSSVDKIFNPVLPTVGNITLILLGVAILVKIWLFAFYSKIAKTINSSVIKASALDSLTDCIATALVLVSSVVARVWGVSIDGYAGIFVAVFIVAVLVEYRTVQINAVTLLLAVKCLLDMITLFIEDKLMTHFSVFASSLGMLTSYLIASQVSKGHRFFAWIFILFASVLSLQSLWGMFVSTEPYFSVYYKNHLIIPYGATNIIATALIPTFFLYKKIENKALKIGYITLVTLGIIATKSRGGMVLFAICLLIKLVLYCKKNNNWK